MARLPLPQAEEAHLKETQVENFFESTFFFFLFKRSLFGYILFQVLKCLNSHTIKVTASYVRFYVF